MEHVARQRIGEETFASSRGQSQRVAQSAIDQLHRSACRDGDEIRRVLGRLAASRTALRQGITRTGASETMRIERVDGARLVVRGLNFGVSAKQQIFANGQLDGQPYFFVLVADTSSDAGQRFSAKLPPVIYRSERRERARALVAEVDQMARVRSVIGGSSEFVALVRDTSPSGLSLLVPDGIRCRIGDAGRIQAPDECDFAHRPYIEVRNTSSPSSASGWQRIGVRASEVPFTKPLLPVHRNRILEGTVVDRVQRSLGVLRGLARASVLDRGGRGKKKSKEVRLEIVDFETRSGERIRGIIDRWGDRPCESAVLIPPAWGRTKETMVGLARTIVSAFASAGEPVLVLRFDGIRKRGESHNDPECRVPGREQHHFTFSQGVEDIQSALDFVFRAEETLRRASLVTFSAAAIEGRRAVALEQDRMAGWVSVVGAADLQSAMCTVSGGVDYLGGAEQGVTFGIQEVQGVEVDMDLAARDALDARLAFLEDARRDMASIRVPITWIHGRFDAWMDLKRTQEVMGTGPIGQRRLIVVPTGHQLRTSREALDTFALIANELVRFSCGRDVRPVVPDTRDIRRRASLERGRLPRPSINSRAFWHDYLVGRDGGIGIDLLAATSAFKEFMRLQVRLLHLREADSVVDLGSGTGSFLSELLGRSDLPAGLRVLAIDFVRDALLRSRRRIASGTGKRDLSVYFLVADLDLADGVDLVPVEDHSQDAILASLVLSYVKDPSRLLGEVRRIAKSGAIVVLSTMKQDADTSRLFLDGSIELRERRFAGLDPDLAGDDLDSSLRSFLNDAAKLLDFEEQGVFRFWSREGLSSLLRDAGFRDVSVTEGLGSPPQALIASARCP